MTMTMLMMIKINKQTNKQTNNNNNNNNYYYYYYTRTRTRSTIIIPQTNVFEVFIINDTVIASCSLGSFNEDEEEEDEKRRSRRMAFGEVRNLGIGSREWGEVYKIGVEDMEEERGKRRWKIERWARTINRLRCKITRTGIIVVCYWIIEFVIMRYGIELCTTVCVWWIAEIRTFRLKTRCVCYNKSYIIPRAKLCSSYNDLIVTMTVTCHPWSSTTWDEKSRRRESVRILS